MIRFRDKFKAHEPKEFLNHAAYIEYVEDDFKKVKDSIEILINIVSLEVSILPEVYARQSHHQFYPYGNGSYQADDATCAFGDQ